MGQGSGIFLQRGEAESLPLNEKRWSPFTPPAAFLLLFYIFSFFGEILYFRHRAQNFCNFLAIYIHKMDIETDLLFPCLKKLEKNTISAKYDKNHSSKIRGRTKLDYRGKLRVAELIRFLVLKHIYLCSSSRFDTYYIVFKFILKSN